MALPALVKTYHAHGNVPFPDVSTASGIWKSFAWVLKVLLTNEAIGGTQSGTRPIGSIWTHVASCDSVTVSTGVDLWGSAFDPSKIVYNNSGSAHSWWKGTNGTYDIVLDLNTSTVGLMRAALAATGTFSAGTTTVGPVSATDFYANSSSNNNAASNASLYTDATTVFNGVPRYANLVTNTSDLSFTFITSTVGKNMFSSILGVQKTSDAHPSDTRNTFWITGTAATPPAGKGASVIASGGSLTATTSCVGRSQDNSTIQASGIGYFQFGGTWTALTGPDVLLNEYWADPIPIRNTTSGLQSKRGFLTDWYITSGAPVGASIPGGSATQERIVAGDLIIPFPVVVPYF